MTTSYVLTEQRCCCGHRHLRIFIDYHFATSSICDGICAPHDFKAEPTLEGETR